MLSRLKALFTPPQPTGPERVLREFVTADHPIAKEGVSVEGEAWRITAADKAVFRLFEVAGPGVESGMLTWRAELAAEGLASRAYLEMWCRFPGRGEFFSKGFNDAVRGTADWASCQTPFYLKKGQAPDLVKLNLVLDGPGTVRLRRAKLLFAPLAM
jgi:hypothetical protein